MLESFTIKTTYIIISISILILLVFGIGSYKYINLNNRYNEIKELYQSIAEKYVVEKANNASLQASLDNQNRMIELYKKDTKDLEEKVKSLNNLVEQQNKEILEYKSMGNREVTDKDAIEWLKQQVSSLH